MYDVRVENRKKRTKEGGRGYNREIHRAKLSRKKGNILKFQGVTRLWKSPEKLVY